jgi:NitT/TauT family transport system ATP-binding protein
MASRRSAAVEAVPHGRLDTSNRSSFEENARAGRAIGVIEQASAHVSLRAVEKIFPAAGGRAPVHALGPIDLDIRRGEFFAVVGPSGCGKSSLFEIIAGLSEASAGHVEFEGATIRGTVPDGVGVVFQEDACLPWLNVRENIEFGFLGKDIPHAERRRRLAWVIELTGLVDFAKSYPAQLSGGMRQRVCIARTLVMQPRLILLDEPFASLDQQTRLVLGEEILRLWRQTNATVFLITHALDEATMLADRIGVMSARPGRLIDLVETGWPRERDSGVIELPEFGRTTARLWKSLRHETTAAVRS